MMRETNRKYRVRITVIRPDGRRTDLTQSNCGPVMRRRIERLLDDLTYSKEKTIK